eukprot:TRINITY_DN103856_c0_g1_i1.p1 TRINITY_DN103856_c0_g1~~TRINITY_DN103856_c0_g1_i1.p1  ORF type:complete len:102 (-),score=9.52 TRINITY_DN103856_c0_g1_i1:59-364(-)
MARKEGLYIDLSLNKPTVNFHALNNIERDRRRTQLQSNQRSTNLQIRSTTLLLRNKWSTTSSKAHRACIDCYFLLVAQIIHHEMQHYPDKHKNSWGSLHGP